ncbi:hypothetical protein ACFSN5_09135 [Streptococcus tangpeifui]|uniref:hypothetical protein n=1 Tax=Streptococcus tangpeifui TaxID=2709400 RepID=UPI0013EE186D|nr:hypothetical protein [Streptococcus sp. ZJ373]
MKCQAFEDFKATSLDKLSCTTGGATDGEVLANRMVQGKASNGEIAMYTWNIVKDGWVNSLMSWGTGGYNSSVGYNPKGNQGFRNYSYDVSTGSDSSSSSSSNGGYVNYNQSFNSGW